MATLTQAAPPVRKRRQKATSRDILANLFLVAWICVLLQGALRKWVFPGASIIYLIQDVPLLFAYILAIWKGLVWMNKLAWLCIVVAVVLSIHTLLQIIFGDLQMRVAVVGLHHYIFYLPILFLAPVALNAKHRRRFMRWNMLAIVPMALLAALQSRAPKAAWINRTSAGDETGLGLSADTVRATGTFNFTLSYSIWCGMALALVLGEWLLPPERRSFKSKVVLLVCTLSAVLATMVSGSRTAVMLSGLGFLGGFFAVIVMRNAKYIVRFAFLIVTMPVVALVASIVDPASFAAVESRFSGERYQEELSERIDHMFVGFLYVPKFSPLGAGIGYGVPAANPGAGAASGIILSELEPVRIVQELGSFTGTAYVFLRYAAGIVLAFGSFACLWLPRRHSFPHAVPLAFSVAPMLMVGQVTRTAPVIAPQMFYVIALILSAILFRQEPLDSDPVQSSVTR